MTDFVKDEPAVPKIVDRRAFETVLDSLRVREKADTRKGDTIAAARRQLPMVEVDATIKLIGPRGEKNCSVKRKWGASDQLPAGAGGLSKTGERCLDCDALPHVISTIFPSSPAI